MQGLDQSIVRDDGIVDYCRLNDITIQAWSPFQASFFGGPFLGSARYPELNAVVDRLAEKYGVPAEAIAVAWITRHPAQMQVVLGTTTPERVSGALTMPHHNGRTEGVNTKTKPVNAHMPAGATAQ
jgi:predicted oxidoreductase